jgi:aerobic-type carbon monoxide dehydrogenase small subunit (CoxS/CutS family)
MSDILETDAPTITVQLRVNGGEHALEVEPRLTLADALRTRLGLTGTKLVCAQGACGACTVLVNGERVTSCIMLAVMADGSDITTIEGMAAPDGTPHPLQAAFVEHDALQCGFCTPGQIMSAAAFLRDTPQPTENDIRRGMSGNLCRCAAYIGIREAIADAAGRMEGHE